MTSEYEKGLQDAIKFHGHLCAGLAIGYMASKVAIDWLELKRSQDEELVAIVESDGCAIDAIQSMLGCSIGKGNLIFRDYGKMVFTVIRRDNNKAVRIALSADVFKRSKEENMIMKKAFSDDATEDDQRKFWDLQQKWINKILSADKNKLFHTKEVHVEIPEKAKIFDSVICHFCGESVMEPRARLREGKPACIPCAENYTRGW